MFFSKFWHIVQNIMEPMDIAAGADNSLKVQELGSPVWFNSEGCF